MKEIFMATLLVLAMIVSPFAAAQETAKADASPASEPKKAESPATPQLIKVKPFYYCALEMTGSYEQHSTAFPALYQEAAIQALGIDGEPFGIYWNDPQTTPEADLKWELGFPLTEKTELKAPLVLKMWEFGQLVSMPYEGAFESEDMGLAYKAVFDWIEKNGYVPAGPAMEKFLNRPSQDADGKWAGKVEILIPVVKAN